MALMRNLPVVREMALRSAPPPSFLQRLQRALGVPVAVLDLRTQSLSQITSAWLPIDCDRWLPLAEELARRVRPAIVEQCSPLAVLAVPVPAEGEAPCEQVAMVTLLTEPVTSIDQVHAAAAAVGADADAVLQWSAAQQIWPAGGAEQLASALMQETAGAAENRRLKAQLTNVSQQLMQTFDELNLLHRLHQQLKLSVDEPQILELVVQWLRDVLPGECLLACIDSMANWADLEPSREREWICAGRCPVPKAELDRFLERLGPSAHDRSVLVDRESTSNPTWYYPDIREAISVPIRSGQVVFGWLVAINRRPEGRRAAATFGSLELSLMESVASVVGMHAGNVRLYKDQSEFFESVVRAFSFAIDAKDRYTHGHSDRVARIAVLLARELGCSAHEQNVVYLSGLLHDIGKIGIDDGILRKPGPLTYEEMEQIKQHPEMGHRILQGVRQLSHVLPVVLHHHEAWDGSGYPSGLAGEEIPWLARIAAVADAFDAMSSDRPYRAGMPREKLDSIFRAESGKQWDPQVVDALFAVRDEVEQVVRESRSPELQDASASPA